MFICQREQKNFQSWRSYLNCSYFTVLDIDDLLQKLALGGFPLSLLQTVPQ